VSSYGRQVWDEHAQWWKQTFTAGADPEYERVIIPLVLAEVGSSPRRVLDVGTGEGQVARALHGAAGKRGRLVVGIDPSSAQLANAKSSGGGPVYVQAAGEQLPFPDACFDAVVCCLVIEHAEDPDTVLAEMARVLAVGGRLVLLINHPLFQGSGSGFIDDQILGEHYWRVGAYLKEAVEVEEVDPGIRISFAHRPLSRYVNPLAERDVVLVQMEEPGPPAELLEASLDPELEGAIPRLCSLCFERRPRGGRRVKD
jgi:SAM-dependent methyltransferase